MATISKKALTKGQYLRDINEVLFELRNKGLIRYSYEARDLIMMTVMHESCGLLYDRQMNGGPALGYVNMERKTHEDLYDNYLRYRSDLYEAAIEGVPQCFLYDLNGIMVPKAEYLIESHKYAIKMARIHYFRVPESIPQYRSKFYLLELSEYCKKYYNGPGKATAEKYFDDYATHWLSYQG